MKYLNVLMIILLFSVLSCSKKVLTIKETPVVELAPPVPMTDSLETVVPSQPVLPDAPIYDEYSGHLPCADCPGIDYKLTLTKSGVYSETISYADLTAYQDKSDETYIYHGNFTVIGDTVFLDKGEDAIKYFLIVPQGLLLLDTEKEILEGEINAKYILTKKSLETAVLADSEAELNLDASNGAIDFYAIGGEPDWRLDLDFDSTMSFKSLISPFQLNMPIPIPEKTDDSKIVNYYYEADTGVLDITLFNEPCVDAMSGEEFPYKVRVEAKDRQASEFNTFLGCGRYLVKDKLSGTFQVIAIDDTVLNKGDFKKGLPNLRFNFKTNRIFGRMTCNPFSGFFTMNGREIIFQKLWSAGFPCETYEFEGKFLKRLIENVFRFNVEADSLTLKADNGASLKLIQVK